MSGLPRPASALAFLALALAACNGPPPKKEAAAVSSAPAPSALAAPAQPTHHWAFQSGDQYGYLPAGHGEAGQGADQPQATMVRYLGMQDGVYTIAEVEGGAVVVAQCAPPCRQVRLRGKDLDQTLDLSPDSIVYAALIDAINGQLQVHKPPARQ